VTGVSKTTEVVHRPSLVQFSIRDLLWLMVWASLGSLTVGAILPRLSQAERPRFLVAVGLALLFAAAASATALLARARLERNAGPTLLVVSFKRDPATMIWLLWLIAGAVFPLLGMVIAVTDEGYHMILRSGVFCWVAYLSIEKAIAAKWKRGYSLEFCTRGLLYQGKHFIPAERIVECYWGSALPNRLFINVPAGQRWEIDVDPQQHEAVSRALDEQVPAYRAADRSVQIEDPVRDAS